MDIRPERVVDLKGVDVPLYAEHEQITNVDMTVDAGCAGMRSSDPFKLDARAIVRLECLKGHIDFVPIRDDNGKPNGIVIFCYGGAEVKALTHALNFTERVLEDAAQTHEEERAAMRAEVLRSAFGPDFPVDQQ